MKDHTQYPAARPQNRLMHFNSVVRKRLNSWNTELFTRKLSTPTYQTYRFKLGQQGITLLLLLVAACIIAINYNNPLFKLLVFFCLSLFCTSLILAFSNIRNLSCNVPESYSGFAGQDLKITLDILSHTKITPQNLEIDFLDTEGEALTHTLTALSGNSRKDKINFTTVFTSRGVYRIDRIRIGTLFPLGLVKTYVLLKINTQIVVFPKPLKPTAASNPVKHASASEDSNSDTLLKSYQQGDPASRIHWPSVAAERGLFIRYTEETGIEEAWIDWFDYPEIPLEQRLSHLVYLVTNADKNKLQYGLRMPNREVPPSTGIHHRYTCLMMLAKFNLEKQCS